jgi:phage baseplate assembly protein W
MNKGYLLKVTKGQRWQDLGSQYGNNEAKDNSAEGLNTVLKRPSSGPKQKYLSQWDSVLGHMTYEPLDEASSVALLAKDSFPNTYHPRVELGSKRLNADVSTNTLINLEDHRVSKDENEMFSEEVPSPNPNGKHPYAHMGSVTH